LASVELKSMASKPDTIIFSKWSLSKAVLFCESKIFASYPKVLALAAAVSAKKTNQGLLRVETTTAILPVFFRSSFLLLQFENRNSQISNSDTVIYDKIFFINILISGNRVVSH